MNQQVKKIWFWMFVLWISCTGLFPLGAEAAEDSFQQGIGYESGAYDREAVQPTAFNWTRQSRYKGQPLEVEKWFFETGDGLESSPAIDGNGVIYVGSNDGMLYALDSNAEDSAERVKWSYDLGDWIVSSPIIDSRGTIYVGSYDGKLYALDSHASGDADRVKWFFETGDWIVASPAIGMDGTIYIGSYDGKLYALNPDASNDTKRVKWSYDLGDWIVSSPIIDSRGTIYVGSYDGKLYALDSHASGDADRVKWIYDTGLVIESSPAIGPDGTIYIGSYNGKLYALDPDVSSDADRLKWFFETEGAIISSPAIGEDHTIYFGSADGKLYAIDPTAASDADRVKWFYKTDDGIRSSPLIDADGVIYIGSYDRTLYTLNSHAVNEADRLLWNYQLEGEIRSSPVIGADGTLYVGSLDGKLYAIGKSLSEDTYQDGDYKYEIKTDPEGSEYVIITDYTGKNTVLSIPDTLGGRPVKEIGERAFYLKGLNNVIIPDSVTSLGDWSFYGNYLKSVVIGKNVKVIGRGSFDSNQLEDVIIPDNVTDIGDGAFRKNRLKSVQIGNSVERIGAQTFASNQLATVTFPESLLVVGSQSFNKNQLQKVSIPDEVTSIENSAFEENQLTSVQIGHNVESIGASAFASNRLTSIRIPNNVKIFGPSLFRNNPLKVIIGELDSEAQTYAESNGVLFLNFDPWSSVEQVQQEAETTVTAFWSKAFSLQYQWMTTEETPILPTEPEGNGWTVFESGDTLRHSLDEAQTIDSTWYVHIYAEDENGRYLFAVHSGAFLLEAPEQVIMPAADPVGGTVPLGTKVSLSTETEGATIYFTTDGSTPSSSSTPYMEPIEVTSAMTLKAIAMKSGMLDSEVMTESYTILQPDQVAKPVADPSGGAVLSGTKVALSTETEGAAIYYTTDGIAPTRGSMEYTAPIEVASEMLIKAIAVKEGMLDSEVMEEHYTILPPEQVAKPIASPSGGAVPSGTKVTVSTSTEGAAIYYTTDGSAPTSSSVEYTAPIEVASEMLIKAIAVKEGMLDSEVMEEHYTILPPEQVAKPIASPSGGAVPSGTKVTLSTSTEGATIYYTTDGSEPTSSSAEYTAPIEVTEEMTIKAIAVKNGMLDSEVIEEQYTIATIPAPANLTASAANRSVTLEWDAVTETGSVTYAVYQAEGASAPINPANWKLIQSNVTANSYIVTGLTNGTTYAFAVKAISVEGASDFSNVATATPRAPGGNGGSGGGGGDRMLSNNADLADLKIWAEGKSLKLSPSFASETTEYTASTEAEQVELVAKEAHSAAKVILNDKVMTDRVKVDLAEDKNTFIFTVQAENGTKKTYTLTIYREMPKPNEPIIDFTDIAGHWAENYIERATAKGIVSGYPDGTFKPNNPVTRAEFTVMLAGALNLKGAGAALAFKDHDQIGAWAKQAVARAVQAGIVDGYSDGSFRPNAQITRAEMAVMIARALKLQIDVSVSTGFADDEVIPQWVKGAVEAIRKLGIVDGRGGNRFVPNETATRAEATVMLLRMLEHKQ